MSKKILYLTRTEIESLLEIKDVLEYAEEAFKLFGQSQKGNAHASFAPLVAYHTRIPNSDIDYRSGTMDPIPTIMSTQGYGYGDNMKKHGIPNVYAIGLLADLETGVPLAIMDAYYISFIRTAAAEVVASKYLAKKDAEVITFIGCGGLAKLTLKCHLAHFKNVKEIRCWSRTELTSKNFVDEMSKELNITIKKCDNAKDATQNSDIIYCNTRSREAIVMNDWLSNGVLINSFGSDASGKQELDPTIFNRSKIIVDSLAQCKIGGDIHKSILNGTLKDKDVYGEFGEIVNGWKQGRENDNEIIVMDSTGVAALDIVTSYKTYQKAQEKGIGIQLNHLSF